MKSHFLFIKNFQKLYKCSVIKCVVEFMSTLGTKVHVKLFVAEKATLTWSCNGATVPVKYAKQPEGHA